MSNKNSTITRDKGNPANHLSSDSDSEPELTDEQLANMTEREIMTMNLKNSISIKKKMKKLENKTILKIHKSIEQIKATQVEQEARIESLEDKEKETCLRTDNIDEKVKKLEDEVRQNRHNINTNKRTLEETSETIDARTNSDSMIITELKERIEFLERQNDEQLLLKQFNNEFNSRMNEIRADMIKMREQFAFPAVHPIQPVEAVHHEENLRDELNNAGGMNYRSAIQTPAVPSNPQETNQVIPKPIKVQTAKDVMRESASNIGIGNVSDSNIRRFPKRPDVHRFSKEEVFKGEKFSSARSLFVEFFLLQIMKFQPHEIRFRNVRMCREPEKGILWIQSDPSFIKSMNIKAATLRNREINLVMFTPGAGFERVKAIRQICESIRSKDKINIKTQIRPGMEDFEVFVKNLLNPTCQKYIKLKPSEIDPNNELPDFQLKEMNGEELKEYHKATMRAIRDAEAEEESNSNTSEEVERTSSSTNNGEHNEGTNSTANKDPTFTEVGAKNKRKISNKETPEKEISRPEKSRREFTPESVRGTVSSIHSIIGYSQADQTNVSIESD